jgi:hypothetical protein
VLALERQPVERVGDQRVLVLQRREREVRRVPAVRVDQHVRGRRPRCGAGEEVERPHARPAGVELRPARHAVQVGRELRLRQREQLLPAQGERVLHEPVDGQGPRRRVELRDRPDREHRELLRRRLARRQARRIDAEFLGAPAPALAEQLRRERRHR